MSFEFASAGRILFGPGRIQDAGRLASELGKRALVITGASSERAAYFEILLQDAGLEVKSYPVAHEPTIANAQEGKELAREMECDVVVSIGGGSAIDAGKAISALMTNPGHPLEYLEVIGEGKPLQEKPVPFMAIPTTAGTGSEVTRNAVLKSEQHQVKVSLRSAAMLPTIALVDPELTHSLPPEVTASTGLDALTQVIEPFVSSRRNPVVDGFCREGMAHAARGLLRAYRDGNDAAARNDMALTSLLGGMALANAGLGAVHGFAGPFGGMYPAPHGATCAALLPHVMKVNLDAIEGQADRGDHLGRFREIAQILTGDPSAEAQAGVDWLIQLSEDMNIPGLGTYGLEEADFPMLIEKAAVSSSMKGNPIPLETDQLEQILRLAM